MEKVIKSVNALKFFYGGLMTEEKPQKDVIQTPKDRQGHCNLIAESLVLGSIKSSNDFPGLLSVSVETLLQACSDDNSDVRLTAEDCLNRIIKGLYDTNIGKILVELYKDIKKNGRARSLRASLSRFSDLSFNIRPAKCRPYILNLLPCLVRISQRDEEIVQECLSSSVSKIFSNLGNFASESEIQGLIASFLKNLSHNSVTVRRTSGACLYSIVANSRKISTVLFPLINSILDILSQRSDNRSTILGCLQSLRTVIPLLLKPHNNQIIQHRDVTIKVFEAAIHYMCNDDHTIITASLELVEQLLKSFLSDFHRILLDRSSFIKPTFIVTMKLVEEIDNKPANTSSENSTTEQATLIENGADVEDSANGIPTPSSGGPNDSGVASKCNSVDTHDGVHEPLLLEQVINSNEDNISENVAVEDDKNVDQSNNSILTAKDIYKSNDESQQLPMFFLSRILCQRFLLSGKKGELLQDLKVRVSIKNLALNCFSLLVKAFPTIFCHTLHVTQDTQQIPSMLYDVLLYQTHSDPKLRGAVLTIAASFLDSTIRMCSGGIEDWYNVAMQDHPVTCSTKCPEVDKLIGILVASFTDDSSTTVRQACSASMLCLRTLLGSMYYNHGLMLLQSIIALRNNPYWLLKVDVLEILASVNYRQITFLEAMLPRKKSFVVKTQCFQQEAINIVMQCLSEDDIRIRKSAAETLVAMVENYATQHILNKDVVSSEAFELCRDQLGSLLLGNSDDVTMHTSHKMGDLAADKSLLKIYRGYESNFKVKSIKESLSFVVSEITMHLSQSSSKHLTYGCILALKLLSIRYQPCSYPDSWGLYFTSVEDKNERSRAESNASNISNPSNNLMDKEFQASDCVQQLGALPLVLGLLKSSWLPIDIYAHSDALILAGNLMAGATSYGFQMLGPVKTEGDKTKPTESKSGSQFQSWSCVHDHVMGSYAHDLFMHLMKLISITHHVISDIVPNPINKSVLPNLTSNTTLPSPIKRKDKNKDQPNDMSKMSPTLPRKLLPTSPISKPGSNKEDPDKDKVTKKSLGSFHQSRVLMRLHEQLVGAFKNYKGSLDFGTNDKFCSFLRSVLDVSCQIIELASFNDIGSYTEEILSYLKSTFALEPTLTIQCVQQLLKALFGTNLVSQLEPLDDAKTPKSPVKVQSFAGQEFKLAFSHQIFHQPLNHLTMAIANSSFHHSLQSETTKDNEGWFGSIKKKVEKKLNQVSKTSKGSKSSIQNYIRLFESLVIKSLKLYTVTSSVEFQKHVLNLLAQLVQLRVNYCMLDSDQVFINFIIKQFESIESGMIRGSDSLVPHVFFFLVLLSYEKYHSKSVIIMPKIIQLCDGLMASGRGSTSHVIPAMEPIVHDLFVVRASSKQDIQEMMTQREVVQSMLLKLIQHPQVFDMITTSLQYSRRDNAERWKQHSRQVADMLLPLMDKLQIEMTSHGDIGNLHSLFEALSSISLRPTDLIIEIMMSLPSNHFKDSTEIIHRWLAKILVILRILICHVKEADILDCLSRLNLNIGDFSCERFNLIGMQTKTQTLVTNGNKLENTPGIILATFFHQVLGIVSNELADSITNPTSKCDKKSQLFICQELSELLLNLTYMHRSGSFKQFTIASRHLLYENTNIIYTKQQMLDTMHLVGKVFPIITVMWAQYLSHLGYIDIDLWSMLTGHGGQITNNEISPTINRSIINRGSVILLADYVFCLDASNFTKSSRCDLCVSTVCQNLQQFDLMFWLIENHVYDIINLSGEPPVQDFLCSVRQSLESKQFIASLTLYCSKQKKIKASIVEKILRCIDDVHESCSGILLNLFITRHFIFSPFIAIAQSCDQLSCDNVETLLALDKQDALSQLSIGKLDEILESFKSPIRQKRFGRLYSLLSRLKGHLSDELLPVPNFDPVVHDIDKLLTTPDKTWFKNVMIACCESNQWPPECAKVLACSEYEEIMEVMNDKCFHLSFLKSCVSFGISEVLSLHHEVAPYPDDLISTVMKASLDKLQQSITKVIASLSEGDVNFIYEGVGMTEYSVKLSALCEDSSWVTNVFLLCECLVQCLRSNDSLPSQYKINKGMYKQCLRIAVLSSEIIYYQLCHGSMPTLSVSTTCLEVVQQSLKIREIYNILVEEGNTEWIMCITQMLHATIQSYVGELLFQPPYLPQDVTTTLDVNKPTTSGIRLSQILDTIRKQPIINYKAVPSNLIGPIYNITIHLAATPLLNSYMRIPHILWKYGWNPPPEGSHGMYFPEVPSDYLQEKDVLSDFIGTINHIGWINRTQFEETWASLLGVLVSQPVGDSMDGGSENEDSVQLSCLAIRGLTSLVINCSLLPHGGQTATSQYKIFDRHFAFKLVHTRSGRQLAKVRGIIDEELQAMIGRNNHFDTHHYYQNRKIHNHRIQELFRGNTERVMSSSLQYGLGQCSVRSFRELHGISPLKDEASYSSDGEFDSSTVHSSEYDNSYANDDSDGSDMFDHEKSSPTRQPEDNKRPLSPLRIRDGVDVHSCVQFILDLYTEWFRTTAQSSLPGSVATSMSRSLLCECVRSLLLISDLFTERQQFEWMFNALNILHSSQPTEDEIMLQYIVASMCKSGSVIGMGPNIVEILVPVLEQALGNTLISCRLSALYGALYCLECYPNTHMRPIIDILIDFVPTHFVTVSTSPSVHNEEYIVVLASVAFYLIEKCQDIILPEFTSVIIQACVLVLSVLDTTSTPSRVYHSVIHGLERLVLAFALSSSECDSVLKIAAEQLQINPLLSRATAACGLMLTCMYCGHMRVSTQTTDAANEAIEHEDAIETRLLAMERISLLFERIRKGYARDARVMARVLPRVLDDFFPAQDVMNKVIAEFISTLQPFPDMIAPVVHEVFQTLHSRDKSNLVQEWVMLSLSNVIQRTPLSTAIWCLTCLFVSASTNHWINSLLPVVVSRMNRPEPSRDWDCFCKSAIDFYTCQLSEELDRRSFLSIFSTSAHERPYNLLVSCISKINGEHGILQ